MGFNWKRAATALATGGMSETTGMIGNAIGGFTGSDATPEGGFNASEGTQIYNNAFNTNEMKDSRQKYQDAIKRTTPTADKINQESSKAVSNLKYQQGGKLNPLQQAELVNKLNVTRGQQVGAEEADRMGQYYNSVANLAKTKASIELQAKGLAAATKPEQPSLLDKMGLGNIF